MAGSSKDPQSNLSDSDAITHKTEDLSKKSNRSHPSQTKTTDDQPEDSGDPKTTTTLFISNLPGSVNSAKLLERASSIGPVRDAFVVFDPVKSSSRGFGYVRFVLREDAEIALKDGLGEFENQSKPPLVTWAKPKLKPEERTRKKSQNSDDPQTHNKRTRPNDEQEHSNSPGQKKKKKNPFSDLKKDPFGNRIVILQGLPIPPENVGTADVSPDHEADPENCDQESTTEPQSELKKDSEACTGKSITTKALYKKAKKLGRLESVKYPVFFPPSPSSASAHLIFADPTAAAIAQPKLHGHILKGHFLTAALKSRVDATTRLGHAHGGGRVIIRNLEFDITEQDLRYLFAPFGPIHSIDLPTTQKEGNSKPTGRGFGFVWMINEADASKAIDSLNGKKVYAGISDEAIQKETASGKKSEKRKRQKGNDLADRGRVIAVDWVLSKQKYEQAEEAENESQDGDDQKSIDNSETSSSADSSGLENEDDDENGSESADFDEDESSVSSSSEHQQRHKISGKPLAQEDQGTTLFVRNLSFEATEQELHTLFRPFGPLRYARIVMDPKLNRSRGTGFVCLWNKEDAQKILDLAGKLESEGFGHGPPAANGQPSLLQPDPSSSLAARLSLHGRVLGISEAVSREQAEKLRIERDKSGAGKDKRRLYLMREGVIFPNSNEAKALHPADLAARQQSFDQRKALLRSNLSLYISLTRLSIRQIPLYVSERCLKRLARHALNQWRKEVKDGKRTELSSEELDREDEVQQAIKDKKAAPKKEKKIKSKVTQTKIIRTTEKVDGTTGLGKSKGYGFLEMETHADALRVLRWANANPVVDGLLKEWTCEEIENVIQQQQNSTKDAFGKEQGSPKDSKKDEKSEPKFDEKKIEKLQIKLDELRSEIKNSKKNKNNKPFDSLSPQDLKNQTNDGHIKAHRMLIIEFAIENAQTVKKRLERKDKTRGNNVKKNKPENDDEETLVAHQSNSRAKRPRTNSSGSSRTKNNLQQKDSGEKKDSLSQPGTSKNKLGRIISQKRKSKKLKQKSTK